MSTIEATPDTIQAEAQARIAELEPRERELALDALGDPKLAEELRELQAQRAEAEGRIRQAILAREEIARREREAQDDAERAENEARAERARKLEPKILAAAEDFDKKLLDAMRAGAKVSELELERARELRRPTGPVVHRRRADFEAAISHAIQAAEMPYDPWLLDLPGAHKSGPFAERVVFSETVEPEPEQRPPAAEAPIPDGITLTTPTPRKLKQFSGPRKV